MTIFGVNNCHRIDIQDRVRRLQKQPREEARKEVERRRQRLATELLLLQSYQKTVETSRTLDASYDDEMDVEAFDNLDNEEYHTDAESAPSRPSNDESPPEEKLIVLPSTHLPNGHPLRDIELDLRHRQASRYLMAIREAIAEKSFQYSHILRAAPSKSVRTRSRTLISKINDRIVHCCRVYGRARMAMIRLGANEVILKLFQILTRDDIKASTAILNPNIPSASTLQLSWIWQMGSNSASAPNAMRECE